jgi:hypothetical protein
MALEDFEDICLFKNGWYHAVLKPGQQPPLDFIGRPVLKALVLIQGWKCDFYSDEDFPEHKFPIRTKVLYQDYQKRMLKKFNLTIVHLWDNYKYQGG